MKKQIHENLGWKGDYNILLLKRTLRAAPPFLRREIHLPRNVFLHLWQRDWSSDGEASCNLKGLCWKVRVFFLFLFHFLKKREILNGAWNKMLPSLRSAWQMHTLKLSFLSPPPHSLLFPPTLNAAGQLMYLEFAPFCAHLIASALWPDLMQWAENIHRSTDSFGICSLSKLKWPRACLHATLAIL